MKKRYFLLNILTVLLPNYILLDHSNVYCGKVESNGSNEL